ncbi:MAG: hypothetical protein JWQ20_4187 [Conexibacter sp.]|nr:hypothetical protein [Conexibacter sp.]
MTRVAAIPLIVAAALTTVDIPAVWAQAATPTRAPIARFVVVRVRPAVAGVPLLLHGVRYLTGATGQVVVPATAAELADGRALLRRHLHVPPSALSRDVHVRFARWVGGTASIVLRRQVRVDLVNPAGRRISPQVAPVVVIRGTDGSQLSLRTGGWTWLTAERAVTRPGRGWATRPVSYAIREVRAHGANVVQRGRQQIVPSRHRRVTVRALFFSIRFSARDALLGSPIGRMLAVRFPDGHVERHRLGPSADLTLDGLPRGDYDLTIQGPGMTLSQPVSLSRTQDVRVRVISWLDLALVGTALSLVAVGLLVAGRPHIRRPVRAWRAAMAGGRGDA